MPAYGDNLITIDKAEYDRLHALEHGLFAGNLVIITAELHAKLQQDSAFLGALEAEGVDNWDGYSLAQDRIIEANE